MSRDTYGLLQRMREAEANLADDPRRADEARSHIRLLEHLLVHGETHKGNRNLSATAITRNARGFLLEWDDSRARSSRRSRRVACTA